MTPTEAYRYGEKAEVLTWVKLDATGEQEWALSMVFVAAESGPHTPMFVGLSDDDRTSSTAWECGELSRVAEPCRNVLIDRDAKSAMFIGLRLASDSDAKQDVIVLSGALYWGD